MKTNPGLFMTIVVLGLAVQIGVAQATELDFCGGRKNCNAGRVINGASVTVTKVKVNQLAGSNGCQAVEKVHSKNLSGNPKGDPTGIANGLTDSDSTQHGFGLKLRKDCEYRVQFNTTSGCPGDKVVKISLDDQKATPPKTAALLVGDCASLKSKTSKYDEAN